MRHFIHQYESLLINDHNAKPHQLHLHHHLLTCTANTIIAKHKQIGYLEVPCCHTYRPQPMEHVRKPYYGSHTVTPGGVPKYEHSPQRPRTTKLVSDSLRRVIHLD
ncbi:hypothetical protein DEO72_LG4g639 [Vigna unguiculata]|uniref:Uncharacterized protein n=1 Tax=Vigna unguiculata TaxID=3917 RepID=A0A4D6LMF9_VIGUN|nr:hypothetical protein DEO72_LG4g639 [Vigna unguiculata]